MRSEYYFPKDEPTGRFYEVDMPSRCDVVVYPSTETPGEWRVLVKIIATDVVTGVPGDFETRWNTTSEPTQAEIAQVVINMLAHEVQEQFGLNPHGSEVVIPKARQR